MIDYWPAIDTPRLHLRRWMERDLVPYTDMTRDPEVMAFYPHPLNTIEALATIELFEQSFDNVGYGFWAVELRDSLEFIGSVGFEPCTLPSYVIPTVMIGWQFARKFWGKGYAEEAVRAVIRYAFEQLGIRQVLAVSAPENAASMRLINRLGMVAVADAPPLVRSGDRPGYAQKIYQLTAPEEARK